MRIESTVSGVALGNNKGTNSCFQNSSANSSGAGNSPRNSGRKTQSTGSSGRVKGPTMKDFGGSETGLLHHDFIHNTPFQLSLKHRLDTPSSKHNFQLNQEGRLLGALSQTVKLSNTATATVSLNLNGSTTITVNQSTVPRIHPGLSFNASLRPNLFGKDKGTSPLSMEATLTRLPVQVKARYNSAQDQVGLRVLSILNKFDGRLRLCAETTAKLASKDSSKDLSKDQAPRLKLKSSLGFGYLREFGDHTVMSAIKLHGSDEAPFSKVTGTIVGRSAAPTKSECAAEITYNLKEEKVDVAVAGAWTLTGDKIHPATIRARIDDTLRVAASITPALPGPLEFTLGAQWDLPKLLVDPSNANPKVGLKLDLGF